LRDSPFPGSDSVTGLLVSEMCKWRRAFWALNTKTLRSLYTSGNPDLPTHYYIPQTPDHTLLYPTNTGPHIVISHKHRTTHYYIPQTPDQTYPLLFFWNDCGKPQYESPNCQRTGRNSTGKFPNTSVENYVHIIFSVHYCIFLTGLVMCWCVCLGFVICGCVCLGFVICGCVCGFCDVSVCLCMCGFCDVSVCVYVWVLYFVCVWVGGFCNVWVF
jgi:hypothetical protein